MKVLLLNGSRREKGCTYTALSEIAQTLEKQGIQAEIIHAVPETEIIKSVAEKVKTADGLVVGSTVYCSRKRKGHRRHGRKRVRC